MTQVATNHVATTYDVVVIGAGAAGLMQAMPADGLPCWAMPTRLERKF